MPYEYCCCPCALASLLLPFLPERMQELAVSWSYFPPSVGVIRTINCSVFPWRRCLSILDKNLDPYFRCQCEFWEGFAEAGDCVGTNPVASSTLPPWSDVFLYSVKFLSFIPNAFCSSQAEMFLPAKLEVPFMWESLALLGFYLLIYSFLLMMFKSNNSTALLQEHCLSCQCVRNIYLQEGCWFLMKPLTFIVNFPSLNAIPYSKIIFLLLCKLLITVNICLIWLRNCFKYCKENQ